MSAESPTHPPPSYAENERTPAQGPAPGAGKKMIQSTVESVALYVEGFAEVTRVFTTRLVEGRNRVTMRSLPTVATFPSDSVSIRLLPGTTFASKEPGGGEGVVVLDQVIFDDKIEDLLPPNLHSIGTFWESNKSRELRGELSRVWQKINLNTEARKALRGSLKANMDDMLKANNTSAEGTNHSLDADAIPKTLKEYEVAMSAYAERNRVLEAQRDRLNAECETERRAVDELVQKKKKFTKCIRANVLSKVVGEVEVAVKYFVSPAGWAPCYELHVSTPESNGGKVKMTLNYVASIRQETGEDWNNVPVTLHTARHTGDSAMPVLRPLCASARGSASQAPMPPVPAVDYGLPQYLTPPIPIPPPAPASYRPTRCHDTGVDDEDSTTSTESRRSVGTRESVECMKNTRTRRTESLELNPMVTFNSSSHSVFVPQNVDSHETLPVPSPKVTFADSHKFLCGAIEPLQPPFSKHGAVVPAVARGNANVAFKFPNRITIPSIEKGFQNVVIARLELEADLEYCVTPAMGSRVYVHGTVKNTSEHTLVGGGGVVGVDGSVHTADMDVPHTSPGESFRFLICEDPSVKVTYHPRASKRSEAGVFKKKMASTTTQRITLHNTKSSLAISNLRVMDAIDATCDSRVKVKLISPPLPPGDASTVQVAPGIEAKWGSGSGMFKGDQQEDNTCSKEIIEWVVRELGPGKKVDLILEWEMKYPRGLVVDIHSA